MCKCSKISPLKMSLAVLLALWIGLLLALPVSAGEAASFQLEQTILSQGSACIVEYTEASGSAWVGVYPRGQVSDDSLLLRQDLDQEEGSCNIPMDLSAGEYTMVFYANGRTQSETVDFEVTSQDFYGSAREFAEGTGGIFTFPENSEADPSGADSWIGIYPMGVMPENSESLVWGYLPAGSGTVATDSLTSGAMRFEELPAGNYTAYYFPGADPSAPAGSFDFAVTRPEGPIYYVRAADAQPGTAAGQIIFNTEDNDFGRYYWLYWGNDEGILKDHTPLGKVDLRKTDRCTLPGNLETPEGADRVYVFAGTADEADRNTEPFVLSMPEGIRGKEEPLRASFTVITDTHVTDEASHVYNKQYKSVLRDIKQNMKEAGVILNLGDVTNNGREKEYQQLNKLMDLYGRSLPDMYYIMGNHDYALNKFDPSQQQELFLEYTGMPDIYYSFESQGYTFICLSSEGRPKGTELNTVEAYLSEDQLEWLKEELEEAAGKNPGQPIFVFLHQPLEGTVALSEDASIIPNDQLREILDQYSQVVFFSGHTHCPMDAPGAVYDGMGNGASMVHAGCTSQLWDMEKDTYADIDSVDSQGCLIEVYDSYIRIRGRNFTSQEWMGSAGYILYTNR